jgi:hypothetical protein
VSAERLLFQRAGTFCHQVAVPQPNGLLVQAGIPDDGRRDLDLVRLDDSNTILGHVFSSHFEGWGPDHRLDHVRHQ